MTPGCFVSLFFVCAVVWMVAQACAKRKSENEHHDEIDGWRQSCHEANARKREAIQRAEKAEAEAATIRRAWEIRGGTIEHLKTCLRGWQETAGKLNDTCRAAEALAAARKAELEKANEWIAEAHEAKRAKDAQITLLNRAAERDREKIAKLEEKDAKFQEAVRVFSDVAATIAP